MDNLQLAYDLGQTQLEALRREADRERLAGGQWCGLLERLSRALQALRGRSVPALHRRIIVPASVAQLIR